MKTLVFTPHLSTLQNQWVKVEGNPLSDARKWRPVYLEVYHGFRPLAKLMKVLGMLPLVVDPQTGLMVQPAGRCHWFTLYSIVPVLAIFAAAAIAINEYGLHLTNTVERTTTILYLVCGGGCGCVVVMVSSWRTTSAYRQFFLSWQELDRRLGMEQDKPLRRTGQVLAAFFLVIATFGVLMAIGILVLRLTGLGKSEVASHGSPAISLSALIWMTYNVGAFTLPDCGFVYWAKAIELRFEKVGRDLAAILTPDPILASKILDRSEEIQAYRITFQLLQLMVEEVNQLLNPILIISLLSNGVLVSMAIYGIVLPPESRNYAWLGLKTFMGILGFVKFALLCKSGSQVSKAADGVAVILRRGNTIQVSCSTKFEIQMFLILTSNSQMDFTASDYFSISLSFLSTIVGVIITFLITIIQFDQTKENKSCNSAIYNTTAVVGNGNDPNFLWFG